jgi:hypothetical protein
VKSWIFAGAAAVALMSTLSPLSSAALAEPPIGSRLGERTEGKKVADDRDAVHAAHELAGCIVVKRGSAAREMLDSRDAEALKKLQSRMGGELDCIANIAFHPLAEGVRVHYPDDIMRGDLAEELLKRNRPAVAQLQPLPIQKTYSRSWFAFTGRHVSLDEMAACVADTNPSAIMALVTSEPLSDDEGMAFGNLIPVMGPCLVAGTTLDAKKEPLRAALAEALYQRVTNPSESSPAKAAGAAEAANK